MRRPLLALLGAAALLRLLRAAVRWDEVAWLYAAYPGHTVDDLQQGALLTALGRWTGLHPPLWSLLHAGGELLAPSPAIWLGSSALWAWLGVVALARRDRLAGALLATGPIALSYAAEVNDYPLVLLWTGLAAGIAAAPGPRSGLWMGLLGALAAWTHPLAGLVVGLLALTLPSGSRGPALLGMSIGAAPLLPGALSLLTDGGSARQPEFKAALVATDFFARHGPFALLALPAWIAGARSSPALGGVVGAGALAIGLLTAAGLAAPHQFPYWTALAAPAALLAARGAASAGKARWLWGLALLQGLWMGGRDLRLLQDRAQDPDAEAFSAVWRELSEPYSCPMDAPGRPDCAGDALYLLSPGGLNDDDKRRHSAILWRLGLFRSAPRVRPYAFDHADFRHGQPRLVDGFVVYVNDNPHGALREAMAAHPRLWLFVYDHGEKRPFTAGLAQELNIRPRQVGSALLFVREARYNAPQPG